MDLPKFVHLVEVGPRDGLQNEPLPVPTKLKVELINRLTASGLKTIETTSFVSPKRIPQLADATEVINSITKKSDVDYPVLVPNEQGMHTAIQANAKCIAVLSTVSETFSQKNTNCSILEGIKRIEKIIMLAQPHQIKVRGYISCVLGCPYEGETSMQQCLEVAKVLLQLGCYEISLGDTIGVGTPLQAKKLIDVLTTKIPVAKLAAHFHDTYGQALANIFAVLEQGISTVDCSIAGLGGCPYARGASGNVATEDVLYMLQGMGIETGVDLNAILATSKFVSQVVGHQARSKVALAKQE